MSLWRFFLGLVWILYGAFAMAVILIVIGTPALIIAVIIEKMEEKKNRKGDT